MGARCLAVIIPLACCAFDAVVAVVRLPVDLFSFTKPVIRGHLPGLYGGEEQLFELRVDRMNTLISFSPGPYASSNERAFLTTSDGGYFDFTSAIVRHSGINFTHVGMSIGPSGPLLRLFDSLDLVHYAQGAELVINSDLEDFENSACTPGSLFSVAVSKPKIIMGGDTKGHIRTAFGNHSTNTEFSFVSGAHLLTLPNHMIEPIKAIILAQDADYLYTFSSCTLLRSQLPTITVTFSEATPAGTINITSDDYTRWLGDDRCELLLGTSLLKSVSVLNPLMLSGVNLRFTKSSTFFCHQQ